MSAIALFTEAQLARESRRQESAWPQLWDALDEVCDPEIPVLSLWDLGVLQDINLHKGEVVVSITPTYSGCPAMSDMEDSIKRALADAGYLSVRVEQRISPVWTTDWLTAQARNKLSQYGIAPPLPRGSKSLPACPQCASPKVSLVSEFGSTACKALYKCDDCLEPFDYFKCL